LDKSYKKNYLCGNVIFSARFCLVVIKYFEGGEMADYTFRFPIRLPKSRGLSILDHSYTLSVQNFSGELYGESEKTIDESNTFIVEGSVFTSKEEAFEAGKKLRDTLILAFAYCKIGADFGDDSVHEGFIKSFLDNLGYEQNLRCLNAVNGLMVYETNPDPIIARLGPVTMGINIGHKKFIDAFKFATEANCSLSERERISYDLFSNSFFTSNGYARLLFLVMAVEVQIDLQPRSLEAINFVESFISEVKDSEVLEYPEKDSLVGTLKFLRNESIRQGARRLIDNKLTNKEYGGLKASKFFLRCYDLRSSVVHGGQPYPSESEVDHAAAVLETLVANLLSSCLTDESR